jgi:hypothetical protein
LADCATVCHRRSRRRAVGDGDVEKVLQRVAHTAERGRRQIKLVRDQAVTDEKVLIAGSTRANRQQLAGPRAQRRVDVGLATGRHLLSRPVQPLLDIRNRVAPKLGGGEGGERVRNGCHVRCSQKAASRVSSISDRERMTWLLAAKACSISTSLCSSSSMFTPEIPLRTASSDAALARERLLPLLRSDAGLLLVGDEPGDELRDRDAAAEPCGRVESSGQFPNTC